MNQAQFDALKEKLNTIQKLTAEIESFMRKQTELFEVLNQKFPKIGQFTNALKDANELFMFTEHLTECAQECQKQIDEVYSLREKKRGDIKDINKTLYEILTLLNNLNDLTVLKDELKLVLSKNGGK